jgi:polyketide cyclase/dehydrase/lipid transport protein
MLDIERSAVVPVGVPEVFAFLKDPRNLPQWNPAYKKVSPRGSAWLVECESRGYNYELEITWEPDAERHCIDSRNLRVNATLRIEIAAESADETRIKYSGKFEMGTGITGWLGEKFFWSRVFEERMSDAIAALTDIFSVKEPNGRGNPA